MTKKELKNLAQQIAKAERRRKKANNAIDKQKAEDEITRLSGMISTIEEMLIIDDYIQGKFKRILDK